MNARSAHILAAARAAVVLAFAALAAAPAGAAEVELFVTDYNENPTPRQRPLAHRPVRYVAPAEVTVRTADGKTTTYRRPGRVLIERAAAGGERTARLFASRGEYEPLSFLLRPREDLREVFIEAGALAGPGGATIPAERIVVASVESFHGEGRQILMPLGRPWNMGAHATEFFWATVHVPAGAAAGVYRGKVTVTSQRRPVAAIDVELEVLPIRLADPPYSLGMNYSNPKDPAALATHFADMRAHGMTCVGPLYDWHLPVHDEDTAELSALLKAYARAGFGGVCYFATPMNLQLSALAGYGDEGSRRWQQKFIQVMRRLHAETLRHDVPVVMSIGDELTNKGLEGIKIAGRLARFVWEELPEVAAASDMNGYREVMAMAPYLNVAAFNNGWDGIDHHNGGRHLINRAFLEELRAKTGAIPWFVNGGVGRLPYGFFFWKMARYGVRGKVEWYYNLRNERGSLVRTDGAKVWPTLDYERCREGIDDLKYLCKLESLVAAARQAGKATAARAGETLLRKIAAGIADDWSAYTSGGARFGADGLDVMDPDKAASMGDYDVVRRALADEVIFLQKALNPPSR